jgi:hypothetical protein
VVINAVLAMCPAAIVVNKDTMMRHTAFKVVAARVVLFTVPAWLFAGSRSPKSTPRAYASYGTTALGVCCARVALRPTKTFICFSDANTGRTITLVGAAAFMVCIAGVAFLVAPRGGRLSLVRAPAE